MNKNEPLMVEKPQRGPSDPNLTIYQAPGHEFTSLQVKTLGLIIEDLKKLDDDFGLQAEYGDGYYTFTIFHPQCGLVEENTGNSFAKTYRRTGAWIRGAEFMKSAKLE